MDESLQNRICHDCFNQNTDRDCDDCPAHYSQDGICCFGDPDKHDIDTEDCQVCIFRDDCADEVVRENEKRIHAARQKNYWKKTKVTPPKKPRKSTSAYVSLGGLKHKTSEIVSPDTDDFVSADCEETEHMFPRFMKESSRGGLIGMFDMASHFLRNNKFR